MTIAGRLAALVGEGVVYAAADADLARRLGDYCMAAADAGLVAAIAFPRDAGQLAAIMAFACAEKLTVVPQGGMSGLAGGAVPIAPSLLISLERMRAIEEIDPASLTMTVDAGVVLETVQQAADAAGLFFPLDLGGRGSAQIGGLIATNAGGNRVLRYGMMRELVLGIEVVLADGTILTMLNKVLKNNTGYDLKHLFVGSEGTLGIVTRAVLRLYPKASEAATALCGVADYAATLRLLDAARAQLGPRLSAFEVMWPEFYERATIGAGRVPPVSPDHGLYVLIETMDHGPADRPSELAEVIGAAIEHGDVGDAVIAQSLRETASFWAIRDSTGEFGRTLGKVVGFDVSLPTGRIGDFATAHAAALRQSWPDAVIVYFGHIADGNLHIAVAADSVSATPAEVEDETYRLVGAWGGSISAEHGVGVHKIDFLHYSRSPAEIDTMRLLKRALDPRNILNPGKIFR